MRQASAVLLLAAAFLAGTAPPHAESGTAPATPGDIAAVAAAIALAEGLADACDARDAAGAAARRAALEAWRSANRVGEFRDAIAAIGAVHANAIAQWRRAAEAAGPRAAEMVQTHPGACADLRAALAAPAMQVAWRLPGFQRSAEAAMGPRLPGKGAQSPGKGRLHSLAQLSALAIGAMDRAGSLEAARRDRALRTARETAALEAVRALGPIVVAGRVIREDRIRQWGEEEQSVFQLRCAGFARAEDGQRLRGMLGQEAVIAGEPERVSVAGGSGTIVLRNCVLLPGRDGLVAAALPEAGGLEPRPPEAAEAYAGPGQGIAMEEVARVLYTGAFNLRLDGLGNSYTDRDESIYVLLRDGSAYRHEWRFPFTDLNLPVVRRRQPERWFQWREAGGELVLIGADGEARRLARAQELAPWPAGALVAHRWYFLHVGMGGARRDRGYEFRADDTVEATRSSPVAGSLGFGGGGANVTGPGFAYSGGGGGAPAFLSVIGPRRQYAGRYRIEGYSLTIIDEEGREERLLFARYARDAAAEVPENVVIGGEVFWTRR